MRWLSRAALRAFDRRVLQERQDRRAHDLAIRRQYGRADPRREGQGSDSAAPSLVTLPDARGYACHSGTEGVDRAI